MVEGAQSQIRSLVESDSPQLALGFPKSKVVDHRTKITVVMQKSVTVFNAVTRNDQVSQATDGNAQSAQVAVA